MRPLALAKFYRAALLAALPLAMCPSVLQAQLPDVDPNVQFQFEELPIGTINLFPGIDQPPPQFTSNGIVLQFGPYQTTPGGSASMEFAMIDPAPGGIDSPNALFLTGTNALFDLTGASLSPGETVQQVVFQLQGDGSGAPLNVGVNGNLPYVGPAGQLPTTLPDGITVEVIPGELATMATLVLTGNVAQLEIGGNIAVGNLLVYAEDPNADDTPGCTDSTASNFDPAATVDDGSCKYTITFSVDVNATGAPNEPIFLNGTFNNWCGGCEPLDGSGSVWTTSLDLPAGLHEYKFTNSNWSIAESFDGSESCTMTTSTADGVFINRFIEVSGPMTLPTVCWNSCDPCPMPCIDTDDDGLCDDVDPCIGTVDVCGVCNGNNECVLPDVLMGTWVFSEAEGALSVGPDPGSSVWYASPAGSLAPEQVDNSWTFQPDGTFLFETGGSILDPYNNFAVLPVTYEPGSYSLLSGAGVDSTNLIVLGDLQTDMGETTCGWIGSLDSGPGYSILSLDEQTLVVTGTIRDPNCEAQMGFFTFTLNRTGEGPNDIPGCTEVNACNYNPDATVNDGSCIDSDHLFAMTLTFDQYPAETTWSLVDALGDTVMAGGPYVNGTDNFATYAITASLCAGCYTLTVADAFGDGMCCQFGNGGYTFAIDDQTVASGGDFLEFETTEICTPGFSAAGCTYEVALNYDPTAIEDDGSCIFPTCPDPCAADVDEDGICDDIDSCIGALDECGVCNGNGATLACGCEDFPAGACDCEGNQFDALGICGGTCSGDLDGDGECDDIDCCVGGYDECGVCNGPGAIYDCGCNMMAPGACDCNGSLLDALGVCGGDCPSDLDGDGICDTVDDCVGYYDACSVCNGPGPIFTCGCSPLPPGDCDCQGNQLDALGVCGGDCMSDTDGDGLCDSDEVPGCMDGLACNYNPQASDDNGTCVYAEPGYDCLGNCLLDTDEDGICDDNEIPGCMEPEACNYNAQATDNVGCFYPLPGFNCAGECLEDLDDDGVCDGIEVLGCTDEEACNFDSEATEDNGLCLYPVPLYDCLGNCLSDENGDGICDGQEVLGCMDPEACNHNPNATLDDPNLPCLYAVPGYDCLGNGIISGCTDPTACNYNPNATIEDPNLPCLDAIPGYDCLGNCIDLDDNGVCDADEVTGCTYPSAENYNPAATEDDGSCEFPIEPEPGTPCPDIDGDGVVSVPDLLLLLGQFGEEIDC